MSKRIRKYLAIKLAGLINLVHKEGIYYTLSPAKEWKVRQGTKRGMAFQGQLGVAFYTKKKGSIHEDKDLINV